MSPNATMRGWSARSVSIAMAAAGIGIPSGLYLTGPATSGTFTDVVRIPLPAHSPRVADAQVLGEDCLSKGNCVAVGKYTPSLAAYTFVPVIVTEKNGRWSRAFRPAVPGSTSASYLSSVWCSSAGDCVASGSYLVAGVARPMLITEKNGRWGRGETAPLPDNASHANFSVSILWSASCTSPSSCVAVGQYFAGAKRTQVGLIETENRGKWTAREAPMPSDAAKGGGEHAVLSGLRSWRYGVCCRRLVRESIWYRSPGDRQNWRQVD